MPDIIILDFCGVLIVGCAYLLFLPFKRLLAIKNNLSPVLIRKITLLYIFIITLSVASIAYWKFYPLNYFYRQEFSRNAGFPLPISADFIATNYNGTMIHSDYDCTGIVRLDSQEYQQLKTRIQNSPILEPDTSGLGLLMPSPEIVTILKHEAPMGDIYVNKIHFKFKIGFLNDQRTLVFEYIQY